MQQSMKLYQELDRVTGEYVLQQLALKSQGLNVKARLAKVQYDSLKLENAIRSQKEQPNQLLGRPIGTDFSVSEVPEMTNVEFDLSLAQAKAREQRPGMRIGMW